MQQAQLLFNVIQFFFLLLAAADAVAIVHLSLNSLALSRFRVHTAHEWRVWRVWRARCTTINEVKVLCGMRSWEKNHVSKLILCYCCCGCCSLEFFFFIYFLLSHYLVIMCLFVAISAIPVRHCECVFVSMLFFLLLLRWSVRAKHRHDSGFASKRAKADDGPVYRVHFAFLIFSAFNCSLLYIIERHLKFWLKIEHIASDFFLSLWYVCKCFSLFFYVASVRLLFCTNICLGLAFSSSVWYSMVFCLVYLFFNEIVFIFLLVCKWHVEIITFYHTYMLWCTKTIVAANNAMQMTTIMIRI